MAAETSLRVKVERLLENQGSSLRQLAIRHKWNQQTTINRLENPKRARYPDFYQAIAEDFGMSVDALFSEDVYTLLGRTPQLDEVREPLVEMLIEIIEDPESEPGHREVAKKTILALTRN